MFRLVVPLGFVLIAASYQASKDTASGKEIDLKLNPLGQVLFDSILEFITTLLVHNIFQKIFNRQILSILL